MGNEFAIKCPNCSYVPKPNKRSTKNWNVYNAVCPKCRTRLKLDIEHSMPNPVKGLTLSLHPIIKEC